MHRLRNTRFVVVLLSSACAGSGQDAHLNTQDSLANTAAVGGILASGAAGVSNVDGSAGVRSTGGSGGSLRATAGAVSQATSTAGSQSVAGSVGALGAGGSAGTATSAAAAGSSSGAAGTGGEGPDEPAQVDPAAPLTPVAFYPSKDRTHACADASVSIQFNRRPIIKAGGKIQIMDASGAVFDSITSKPSELYFSDLVNRSSGGTSFKTDVLDVVYNTVVFQPKASLDYGKTYYVTVDEGMISDELGTKFSVQQSDSWTFTVRDQAPAAASSYTLAADGSGDYCSVESVLEALPNSASGKRVVQVGPGVYPGIVRMSDSQVHFVGAGMDKSIFSHKNSATMNSTSREGFVLTGSDVTFENLTIFNTYLKDSNGQQAEALYVSERSQKVFLKNVHLRSHQDTLRVDGSAYMEGGKVSGSTDPLWGYGAFYCDGCELSSRSSGHAFVVTRSTKGFGLVNCSVTKESDEIANTYLAQYHDGSEPGKIAFVKCKMDSHIVGWRRAQNNAWFEHENTTLQSGEPLKFDGKQLTVGSAELNALSSAQTWLGWSP